MFNRPVTKEVTGANVLVAICRERQAFYLLNSHGVSRIDVVNFISGISKIEGTSEDSEEAELGEDKRPRVKNAPAHWSVAQPNEEAQAGQIDPTGGSRREVERAKLQICVGVVKTTHGG